MSEPAQLESPQTADAPVENSSESFISSIDAAFDNIGSFDDVEEIRTPIDDGVEDTNQNENNENNQPEGDDGDYSDDVDVTDWTRKPQGFSRTCAMTSRVRGILFASLLKLLSSAKIESRNLSRSVLK